MALIKCPECGKEISDKASACVNCGYPVSALNSVPSQGEKSIQKEDVARPAASVGVNRNSYEEIFGDRGAAQAKQPPQLKPVPDEIPEMGRLTNAFVQMLDEGCAVVNTLALTSLAMFLSDVLRGYTPYIQDAKNALLCILGSCILNKLIQILKFRRVKKFLRKNGYEDSIRNDSENALNAFYLFRTHGMVRYIKKLNPEYGAELAEEVKWNNAIRRKERLRYLPYFAVLALGFYLLFFAADERIFHDMLSLIVAHVLTLVVTTVFGAKRLRKGDLKNSIMVLAGIFALMLYTFDLMDDYLYHIAIDCAVGFVGMMIGKWFSNR